MPERFRPLARALAVVARPKLASLSNRGRADPATGSNSTIAGNRAEEREPRAIPGHMRVRAVVVPAAMFFPLLNSKMSFPIAASPSWRSLEGRSPPARRLVKGKYAECSLRRKVQLLTAIKVSWPHHPRAPTICESRCFAIAGLGEALSSPALASPYLADVTTLALHLVSKHRSGQALSR